MKIKKRLFLKPTENKWEACAVLNPTAIKEKNTTHLIYRAVDKKRISSLGYAKIENGDVQRNSNPLIVPEKDYESRGVEDPRIAKIGSKYYMTYVAFDGKSARTAYAVSKNLIDWKKQGIITPNISVKKAIEIVKIKKYRDIWKKQEIYSSKTALWDKDVVLFPEKINGKFVMLHRFLPDIQVVKFKNFSELKNDNFWENYIENLGDHEDKISLFRRYDWEAEHIGAGATPVKTKYGWLLIYHGVEMIENNLLKSSYSKIMYKIDGLLNRRRNWRLPLVYHAGAALLDLKNPETEITRLKNPLFSPDLNWEKQGNVGNVVFPEGAVVEDGKLKIYYGCSDSRIGVAEVGFRELIKMLKRE